MILYDSIHINDPEMCTPLPKSVTNIRIIAYLQLIQHSFDTLQHPYDVGNVITLAQWPVTDKVKYYTELLTAL